MRHNFNTLLQTIRQYKLFPDKKRLIVAVSGGADSVALLHWLANNRTQLNIDLHVATLNHGIRPEAKDDVKYVQILCQFLNIPCTTGIADVPSLMQQSQQGLEATARRARYDFLAKVAHENDASYIVTAHHADDQAETVLMRIIRGTGSQGLTGMAYQAPVPYHSTLTLLRPLLEITRAEIENYCLQHNLNPRHDATNQDTNYLRNELRHQILPRLRQINPQIDQSLIRLADVIRTEQDFIMQAYQNDYQSKIVFAKRVTIPKKIFLTAHRAMQRHILLQALHHLDIDPNFNHIEQAIEIALTDNIGAQVDFTGNNRLRVDYESLHIEPIALPLPASGYLQITDEVIINLEGDTILDGWLLSATSVKPSHYDAYLNIPHDARVTLRTRQIGDKFSPQGMNGRSKTIKKWMIDQKIPQHLRDSMPLLIIDETIAAIIVIPQWSIAEPFIINENAQRIIYFSIHKT